MRNLNISQKEHVNYTEDSLHFQFYMAWTTPNPSPELGCISYFIALHAFTCITR